MASRGRSVLSWKSPWSFPNSPVETKKCHKPLSSCNGVRFLLRWVLLWGKKSKKQGWKRQIANQRPLQTEFLGSFSRNLYSHSHLKQISFFLRTVNALSHACEWEEGMCDSYLRLSYVIYLLKLMEVLAVISTELAFLSLSLPLFLSPVSSTGYTSQPKGGWKELVVQSQKIN